MHHVGIVGLTGCKTIACNGRTIGCCIGKVGGIPGSVRITGDENVIRPNIESLIIPAINAIERKADRHRCLIA